MGYDQCARDSAARPAWMNLTVAISGSRPLRESAMYAAIRQGKAKAGKAEELTRRIKEGAIPVISGVEGFMGYYVVYAPDDTVIAISLFNNFAAAEESNKLALAWIEHDLAPLLTGPATAVAGPVIVHTLAERRRDRGSGESASLAESPGSPAPAALPCFGLAGPVGLRD